MSKRLFDILVAGASLFALFPLFCFTVLGIRLSSPGSVIHKARRTGLAGQEFIMHKFRTMQVSAEPGAKITSGPDQRIFGFGAMLRKTKIDELPQLWDVLRGKMSVVGPRPEDPDIVRDHYQSEWHETLQVRPGLASPGSIYYYTHCETSIPDGEAESYYVREILPTKIALDLAYMRRMNLWYDVSICVRTAIVIVAIILGKRTFALPKEIKLVDSV